MLRFTPGRLAAAGIVIFWAVMTGQLLRREVWLPRLENARIRVPSQLEGSGTFRYRDDWQGIYYEDTKVGFIHTHIGRSGDAGYTIRNEAQISLRLLDRDLALQFQGTAFVRADGTPERLFYNLDAGPAQLRVKGDRSGDELYLQVVSSGRVIRKIVPITPGFSLSNAITPSLYWPELEPGRTYSLDVFDPLSLSTQQAKVRVVGRDTIPYRGTEAETTVVAFEASGLTFRTWISEAGLVLRQESDLGWYLVREEEETAKQGLAAPAELQRMMEEFATIRSRHVFAKPQELVYLRARLGGVRVDGLDLEGAQQRVVPSDPAIVEISRRAPRVQQALSLPIRTPEMHPFLAPSPLVQSDDPALAAQARAIVGDETNSWRAARLLQRWVYENVEKDLLASIPSAVEVLDLRRGDCNEHTTLFVALARAVGIPTKFAVGVVYNEGSFYYHAWPEVYVGEWVPMDPTFGQDIADATHIKLVEGELAQQTRIAQVIGRLDIEVLADSESQVATPTAS